MLKKVIAGIASVTLALGMVALTAGPASATPEAKVLVCKYVGTPGVDETLKDGKNPISVSANALGHGWDGSTFPFPFSDAQDHSVAIGFEGTTATCPAPQGPPPAPDVDYVTVAWTMPSWVNSTTATWPQQKFASIETEDPNLGALDSQLAASVLCGQEKQWQIDVYYDNATTDSLLAGGFLNGPGNPPEALIPGGWNVAYKLVHIVGPACLIEDAAASWELSAPDCRVNGSATFSLTNATWQSEPPTAPGGPYTITAVANSGHAFPGGSTTLVLPPYTIVGVLDPLSADCYNPKPVKPAFDFIVHCGTYGSITLVDTNYIDYQLVSGDGQQGWNHVVAVAVSPYVLKPGAKADWWIYLGAHWNCPNPKASFEVGPCYADQQDESFENLKVTFDNTESDFGNLFSIPALGIFEWVPAGNTETVTVPVPTSGSPSYDVYAGLKKVLTVPALDEFEGCIGVLLEGDPLHENATCDDGELLNGSIWVDRKEGLKYTITDVTDVPVVVATLIGAGDGNVSLPPGDYEVTLEALPGYVLDLRDPATAGPWSYSVLAPVGGCEVDLPVLSCFLAGEGGLLPLGALENADWIVNGVNKGGAAQSVQLTTSVTTITIEAHSGFVLGDGVKSWKFLLDDEEGECGIPTLADWPTNVTHTNQVCSNGAKTGGTVTVGLVDGVSFFDEVNYYLDGSDTPMPTATAAVAPGVHTVTASAKEPGDGIDGDDDWEFTVLAAPATCDLTTLALTGVDSNPAGWAGLGYYLLIAGLALIAVRTVRRRNEVKQ
jgi:hypothetical protein